MLIILLGPPGAGKGTQAEKIVLDYKLIYISTGAILRSAVEKETALGAKAKEYMDQGLLVPDELVADLVKTRLLDPDCSRRALLDGFPRTLDQAKFLGNVLSEFGTSIDRILYIGVDREELVERLTGRRVCRDCGANYHLKFNPPRVRNVCDLCGGELFQRDDDSVETVTERLSVFSRQTEPLVHYYRSKNLLTKIDGSKAIDQVYSDIKEVLDNL